MFHSNCRHIRSGADRSRFRIGYTGYNQFKTRQNKCGDDRWAGLNFSGHHLGEAVLLIYSLDFFDLAVHS